MRRVIHSAVYYAAPLYDHKVVKVGLVLSLPVSLDSASPFDCHSSSSSRIYSLRLLKTFNAITCIDYDQVMFFISKLSGNGSHSRSVNQITRSMTQFLSFLFSLQLVVKML